MFKSHISIFRKKQPLEIHPLRIEGIDDAPMTATPDDAEVAAQALLESLSLEKEGRHNDITLSQNNGKANGKIDNQPRDAAYYHALSLRVRDGRNTEAHIAMRYIAYCEQELRKGGLAMEQLIDLENGLYRHSLIIEREGGETKKRWQHCLAENVLKQMKITH